MESFYGGIQRVARSNGLKFLAESSAGSIPIHRPLDIFQYVDIPAGEAWALGNFTSAGNISGGLRDAVSAGRIYGQSVTPVEVFTSNRGDWNMSPRFLKPFGDKILAAGGNQFLLHCYIHQPTGDRPPGWTMNRFGTTFNRHVTWWNDAKPWLASIARSQVLLRQGRNVADFCRLLAEDESIVNPDLSGRQIFWDAPDGYANDWITGGNLVNLFRVEAGEFVAVGGARYRLLVLPDSDRMTLETARKLRELVEDGGVILGRRPAARVGLRGGEAADREFTQHIVALWGENNQSPASRVVGKGRVLSGLSVADALARLGVKPAVSWTAAADSQVFWQHRRDGQREIYFLANGGDAPLRTAFSFRVAKGAPEIWSPETGAICRPALYRRAADRLELPLNLAPAESVFVVFGADGGAHFEDARRDGQSLWPRGLSPLAELPEVWTQPDGSVALEAASPGEYVLEGAQIQSAKVNVEPSTSVALSGPWRVSFTGVAAPAPQVFEKLVGWEKHSNPDVRFFSGAATYQKDFVLPESQVSNLKSQILNLGELRELAEVTLNGETLGVLWKPPFRLDVTGKLRAGRNEIAVRVINTWANRLIGDAALPEAERQTWTSFKHYEKTKALPPSGLLGPVEILATP